MVYKKIRYENNGKIYFFSIRAGETEETNTILFASLLGSDIILQTFFGLEDLIQNVIPEYINSLKMD